jgi:hypothetical protein
VPAADLKGHDDAVARPNRSDAVADVDDLGHELVPERKGPG